MEDRDYEAEARSDGWKPEDEWKGDPPSGGFKTAEEFVDVGENINGVLKGKVERIEKELIQSRETNKQFNEFTQRALAKERTEKDALVKQLQATKAQAITDGDGIAVVNAENEIADLQRPEQQNNQLTPMQTQWLEQNNWYQTNENLAAFADGISDRVEAQGYTGQAKLDEIASRTKDAFPDQFGNANRNKPPSVESGGEVGRGSDGKSFDKLPSDAKAAYARFAVDMPGFTKEQYVESYEWED
jgi:hypothetical protein